MTAEERESLILNARKLVEEGRSSLTIEETYKELERNFTSEKDLLGIKESELNRNNPIIGVSSGTVEDLLCEGGEVVEDLYSYSNIRDYCIGEDNGLKIFNSLDIPKEYKGFFNKDNHYSKLFPDQYKVESRERFLTIGYFPYAIESYNIISWKDKSPLSKIDRDYKIDNGVIYFHINSGLWIPQLEYNLIRDKNIKYLVHVDGLSSHLLDFAPENHNPPALFPGYKFKFEYYTTNSN